MTHGDASTITDRKSNAVSEGVTALVPPVKVRVERGGGRGMCDWDTADCFRRRWQAVRDRRWTPWARGVPTSLPGTVIRRSVDRIVTPVQAGPGRRSGPARHRAAPTAAGRAPGRFWVDGSARLRWARRMSRTVVRSVMKAMIRIAVTAARSGEFGASTRRCDGDGPAAAA